MQPAAPEVTKPGNLTYLLSWSLKRQSSLSRATVSVSGKTMPFSDTLSVQYESAPSPFASCFFSLPREHGSFAEHAQSSLPPLCHFLELLLAFYLFSFLWRPDRARVPLWALEAPHLPALLGKSWNHICSIYIYLLIQTQHFTVIKNEDSGLSLLGVQLPVPLLANLQNSHLRNGDKIPLGNCWKKLKNYSKCSSSEEVRWKELYSLVVAELNLGFPTQGDFRRSFHASSLAHLLLYLWCWRFPRKSDSVWMPCEYFFTCLDGNHISCCM